MNLKGETLLHIARHGGIFFIAKSTVLLAPILAAGLLSQSEYGELEWWLALSLSLGPLVAMGAPSIVAYGTIGKNLSRHLRTAVIFALCMGLLLVLLSIASRSANDSWEEAWYGLIALQIGLICFQSTFAARLKGLGKGAWASVVESLLYASLLLALISLIFGMDFHMAYGYVLLCSSTLVAVGLVCSTPLPNLRIWHRRPYRAFARIGIPFMISGSMMSSFMAAPRVLLGIGYSPDNIAEFALVFRWLSLAIIAHQFIHTVFFRKIFGDIDTRQREKLLLLTVTTVALGVIGAVGFVHFAPKLHDNVPVPSDTALLLPMSICIILWATTASLEGTLFRLGGSGQQIRSVAIGFLVMLLFAGVFTFIGVDPASGMAYAWMSGLSSIIGRQYLSLRALGESFPRLIKGVLAVCVVIGSVTFSINQI